MYRDTDLQKTIGQWVGSSFIGGAALFFLAFLVQASALSSVSITSQKIVGFGPLHLIRITKNISQGTTSASFEFLSGIIIYGLVLVCIAVVGAWLSNRRHPATT